MYIIMVRRAVVSVLHMDTYIVNPTFCTVNVNAAAQPVQYFAPRMGPPSPVRVDGGQLLASYPVPKTLNYFFEGARYNLSQCSFCPYSGAPEVLLPEYFLAGGMRIEHTAMYGPCLDGWPSTKIPCVQNLVLYPPDFVGEYFFPDQRVANPTLFPFPFFAHEWVEGTFPGSITNDGVSAPTNYALGKGSALSNLQTLRVMNIVSGLENITLSHEQQAPYLPEAGIERWPKWEQHFCRQGCHRDAQRQLVTVRPSDYQNKSATLAYLNRRSDGGVPLVVVRCARCPRLHAAYNWGTISDPTMAANPAQNLVGYECYPWFGSVPTILPRFVSGVGGSFVLNVTLVKNHSALDDGMSSPATNGYFDSRACPPNTYNDECAHKFKYDVIAATPTPTAEMPAPAFSQPACKPCPAGGWHTAGLSGAWFCLPPPGQTMLVPDLSLPQQSPLRNRMNVYRDSANGNMSLLWARRDILGVEFECGREPKHCYQCAAMGLTSTATPNDFNQQIILSNILQWASCPAKHYCPTALDEPVACPSAFPWSPVGSSSIANCTCARGTYLLQGVCTQCSDRAACPMGQFMSGWTRCTQYDGATSPGVCAPCTNLPPANAAYSPGLGREVLLYTSGAYAGVCPFTCAAGTVLSGSRSCNADYACTAIAPVGPAGKRVFSAELTPLRDGFVTLPNCGVQVNLTTAAARSANTASPWPVVGASCAEVNPSQCASAACVVTRNATFDANYACAPCPQPNSEGHYFFPRSDTIAGSYACSASCTTGEHYFNASAAACLSCAAFDATYCPPQSHISGGGCYGGTTPFASIINDPVAIALSLCVYCSLAMPPAGQWLSLAVSPCAYRACTNPQGLGLSIYEYAPCGNASDIDVRPCTATCPNRADYLKGTCRRSATPVCVACTAHLDGSYLIANCTATADAEWTPCSAPGTFCPGDGSVVKCPFNKTSSPGAASAVNCYCPIGTLENAFGACEPFRCPSVSAVQYVAPGASYASNSFMSFDADQLVTKCVLCPSDSLSIVDDGIGPQSCVCTATTQAYWYNRAADGGRQCAVCPTAAAVCSLGGYSGKPDACWRGVAPSAECVCMPPPFSLLGGLTSGCSQGPNMCPGGFSVLLPPSPQPQQLEDSSGSAVYCPRSAMGWGTVLRKEAAPAATGGGDYTIDRMATTSDWNGWGETLNRQFVVWTIAADPTRLAVFATLAPPNAFPESNALYNPYSFMRSAWVVAIARSEFYVIEEIAVAQWKSPQTQARLFPDAGIERQSFPTHVAAVVRVITAGGGSSLRLYLNQLSVDIQSAIGAPRWNSGLGATELGVVVNATTVDLGHAYIGAGVSTFYLAYNKPPTSDKPMGGCGIAAVSLPDSQTATVSHLDLTPITMAADTAYFSKGRTLEAAAFMATLAGDGVQLYLVFAQPPQRPRSVRMMRWIAGAAAIVETDELYFASDALRVRALHIARPDIARSPIFTALVDTPTLGADSGQAIIHPDGPPLKIKVADFVQRTFTDVQGMPSATRPSRMAAAIPTGGAQLMWIAASGPDIFSIAASQCMPDPAAPNVPRYWDGGQCLAHVCVRSRPCFTEAGQQWDPNAMLCACKRGYFVSRAALGTVTLACSLCQEGFYCDGNGTKTACPNAMTTAYAGATDASECACKDGQFFNGGAVCETCHAGAWCPNRWDSVPCPGSGDSARSTKLGEVYPKSCVCAPGTLGVACEQCPSDHYCPPSTNAAGNFVAMASVLWLSPSSSSSVCDAIRSALWAYLSTSGIDYISAETRDAAAVVTAADANTRSTAHIMCKYVPPPTAAAGQRAPPTGSRGTVVIMVQTDAIDIGNNVVNALPKFLGYNSTSAALPQFVLDGILPVSLQAAKDTGVAVNAATTCPSGKSPSGDRTGCVCSAGYEPSGTQCAACAVNRYKAASGGGVCSACAIGFYSAAASSACVSASGDASSLNAATTSDDKTPLIVGASVGGGVALVLIAWGVFAATSSPTTAPAASVAV